MESFQPFTEIVEALIRDFLAPVGNSTNLCYKDHSPFKVETDGLQRTESFETLTEVTQAFICDFLAPISK